jgi:hypothetical protein
MADSETYNLNMSTVQEYLRPPGDSTRFQAAINGSLDRMLQAAISEKVSKFVIFEIAPVR